MLPDVEFNFTHLRHILAPGIGTIPAHTQQIEQFVDTIKRAAILHPLIACLFAGLMVGSVRWFLATFPVIQVWQAPAQVEMFESERSLAGATSYHIHR